MTGYEPGFSCIRSNEGVNCATTTNLFSNHHMRVIEGDCALVTKQF